MINTKILLTGDSHGQDGIQATDKWITEEGADCGIILGDIWDIGTYTKNIIHIIRGNHEQEALWKEKLFGPKIIPHEDFAAFELGGLRFGVIGRMDEETHLHLLDRGWWLGDENNRAFSKPPMQEVIEKFKPGIDILLTHDAPYPYLIAEDGVMGGAPNIVGSFYLRDVLFATTPTFFFHGHFHELNRRRIAFSEGFGLPASDINFSNRGYAILDTETLEVNINVTSTIDRETFI